MVSESLTLRAIKGIPFVRPGDDLAALLIEGLRRADIRPRDKDVLVVAQKIVSKAEGRLVDLASVVPSPRAAALASEVDKDARLVELILSESDAIVRQRRNVLIVRHRLGFVMANAGIDQSNVDADGGERVLLLPRDPDASAAELKARLDREFGVALGVVINDSFGRPWRLGVVGVALGAAGLPVIRDMVGKADLFGREMRVTEIAVADELAAAASLVMGQGPEGQPAVHVRGLDWEGPPALASALLRPLEFDLFQ